MTKQFLDFDGLALYDALIKSLIDSKVSESEVDSLELITVDDIDSICE